MLGHLVFVILMLEISDISIITQMYEQRQQEN